MRFWLLPLFALALSAQTPSFEVASVHLSTAAGPGGRKVCGIDPNPESAVSGAESALASGDRPFFALIYDAYEELVDTFDLPKWVGDVGHVAISVKIPPNTNARTCRGMLRTLLEERFHLVTAVEPREVNRFYVKIAKSGLKLKPVENPPADPNTVLSTALRDKNVFYAWRGAPMSRILDVIGGQAIDDARARGLDPTFLFARFVDETGLTGYYDGSYVLPIRPDVNDPLAESIDEALTRQLGLTLELRRTTGKVLVIRSGDRVPTEN